MKTEKLVHVKKMDGYALLNSNSPKQMQKQEEFKGTGLIFRRRLRLSLGIQIFRGVGRTSTTVASESAFSLSGRVLSLRRTKLTPESVEMCICLKDHLDSIDRIQDQTTLEDETSIEVKVHDEEVEEGLSPGLSDEELAFEANFSRSQQNDTNL
ncbi:hypothetical protein E3N88_35236 [Mikania micrantha]|uniref:HAT C-terminal dimerisation domain-containing protein n=1 Tax=Mikania micrantha TaxID=192012 RepID=A0A5N6M1B4_9ASTR|nr:hypothetical protein E3N88_35236 [Mikania micrantha]